jgi:hypothetical protein
MISWAGTRGDWGAFAPPPSLYVKKRPWSAKKLAVQQNNSQKNVMYASTPVNNDSTGIPERRHICEPGFTLFCSIFRLTSSM